jgi:DNA-binding CsgD family transcriptional regulator
LGSFFELLPFALLQSGFALFDVYTWLLFIYLGSLQRASGYMVSWGMFFLTLASFFGEVLSDILTELALTLRQFDVLAIGAALLMFFTTLIFQDERETFAGWNTSPAHGLPPEAALPLLNTEETAAALPVAATAPEPASDQEPAADSMEHRFCEVNNLTARECEVARLLLRGRNNPFIRESLNISDNTLKSHLRNIYRKLEVNNRQDVFSLFDNFRKRIT